MKGVKMGKDVEKQGPERIYERVVRNTLLYPVGRSKAESKWIKWSLIDVMVQIRSRWCVTGVDCRR